MHGRSGFRRGLVAVGVVLTVALSLVPTRSPAVAAEDRRVLDHPIPEGAWLGEMDAVGRYAGAVEGFPAAVTVMLNGSFLFDIVEGSASGDWSWSGLMLVDVETPQADAILTAGLQAEGPVGGGDRTLTLTGRSTTTGSVVTSAGSQAFGPNAEAVDLDVQITSASCNTVVGDWATPLEGAIDAGSLGGGVDGTFVATYWGDDIEVDLADRITDLYAEASERSEELFQAEQIDFDAIVELLNRAVDLEEEARRENVCVFENAGRYSYGPMARLIFTWSQWLLLDVDVPADNLWPLVDTLLWINAIGSGADPELEGEIRVLVEEQAQRLFDENLVEDGTSTEGDACSASAPCLARSPDVDRILLIGDRLDLTFDYVGTPVTAAQILEQAAEVDG